MPEFTVIAGPNGAGKSSFSKLLSTDDAIIFDPDKEKAKIWRRYPDIADDAVEAEVTRMYKKMEGKAIKENVSFTIETNMRNKFAADRALNFKGKGYTTQIFFAMLPALVNSIERVNNRVRNKGHFVDLESITTNFELSWKNFKETLQDFDNIILFEFSKGGVPFSAPGKLLTYKSGVLTQKQQDIPQWAEGRVEDIELLMNDRGRSITLKR